MSVCALLICLYVHVGASMLAQSLKQNKHMEFSLVHFDLSGNLFGTDPLASLTFIQEPQTISHLNLSGCGLTLDSVVQVSLFFFEKKSWCQNVVSDTLYKCKYVTMEWVQCHI